MTTRSDEDNDDRNDLLAARKTFLIFRGGEVSRCIGENRPVPHLESNISVFPILSQTKLPF